MPLLHLVPLFCCVSLNSTLSIPIILYTFFGSLLCPTMDQVCPISLYTNPDSILISTASSPRLLYPISTCSLAAWKQALVQLSHTNQDAPFKLVPFACSWPISLFLLYIYMSVSFKCYTCLIYLPWQLVSNTHPLWKKVPLGFLL